MAAVIALGLAAAAPGATAQAPGIVGITSFPATISIGQTVSISGYVGSPFGPIAGIDVTVKRYTLAHCASGPAPVTVLTTAADGTFSFTETLQFNPPVSYGFIVALSQDPNRTPNFTNPDSCVTIGPTAQLSAKAEGSVTVNGTDFTNGVIGYGSTVDLSKDSAVKLATDVGTFRFFPVAGEASSFIPVRVPLPAPKGKKKGKRQFIIELRLVGGDFSQCKKTNGFRTEAATKKPPPRSLWGNGKGHYRTKGRYSSATVTGTSFLVEDLCEGTLTVVKRGVVQLRDLVTGKTVLVSAGHRYLAGPR